MVLVGPRVSWRKRIFTASKAISRLKASFFLGLANPRQLKESIFMEGGDLGFALL